MKPFKSLGITCVLSVAFLFAFVQSASAQAVRENQKTTVVNPTLQLKLAQPDITVSLEMKLRRRLMPTIAGSGPGIAPGTTVGKQIRIVVRNIGSAATGGFFVDLVLSADTNVPVKLAVYSPVFQEDVLLKGGRLSVKNLAPGGTQILNLPGDCKIPDKIRPGIYYLAAVADAGNTVKEGNEGNNVAIKPVKVNPLPPPALPVTITNIGQTGVWPSGSGHFEVSVGGSGFGNTIGNKVVRIGTRDFGAANMEAWSDTGAIVWLPHDFPLGTRYHIRVRENGQTISNVKQNVLLYMDISGGEFCIPGGNCAVTEAPAGTNIQMSGLFGASQGNCLVKFGGVSAQVVSWSNPTIEFVLPNLPPGQYPVFIEKNGERVSFQVSFGIAVP